MGERSRLYLVRHGQTDLNREKRFRGMSDAPLNRLGRREASGAGDLISGEEVRVVHTSPMPRAVQTAEIIAEAAGATVEINRGLIDVDYGSWQGLTVEEVEEKFGPEMMRSWIDDPGGFRFPGGESMSEVRARLEPCLLAMVDGEPGGTVAAVTHMAVLKVSFLVTMELDFDWFWKIGIDNGSVSLFSYEGGRGFVLQSWNRLP